MIKWLRFWYWRLVLRHAVAAMPALPPTDDDDYDEGLPEHMMW